MKTLKFNLRLAVVLGLFQNNLWAAASTVMDSTAVAGPVLGTDYKGNLSIFNWLIVLTIILMIAIIVMAGTLMTLMKSDYFKNKLKELSSKTNSLILIITTGALLMSSNLHALNYIGPGEGEKDGPWLLVETTDLLALLVIDVILLVVVLYLRHLFSQMLGMVRPKAEKIEEVPVLASLKKVNQVLTDAVPIEEEHKILLEHEYDGIQELDNNLPPWWVWGFYATIVFAFIYLINYHLLGVSDLQIKAYDKEVKVAEKEVQAYLNKMAMNVDETSATLLTDASDLSAGAGIFAANCVACHKSKGEGEIGPNLTDNTWIYGYDIKEVFKTVKYGTANGMPEHSSKFNPIQIQQVASYVLSLPQATGLAPQGTIIEK
jgi:cytochrome c oxidase cbb3-type subunit 3